MEVIARFDGRAFPRRWASPGSGRRGAFEGASRQLETIYCPKLTRHDLPGDGHLPGRRPASWYDPGRFWSGDRIEMVPPFGLGGEIASRSEVRARATTAARSTAGGSPLLCSTREEVSGL